MLYEGAAPADPHAWTRSASGRHSIDARTPPEDMTPPRLQIRTPGRLHNMYYYSIVLFFSFSFSFLFR